MAPTFTNGRNYRNSKREMSILQRIIDQFFYFHVAKIFDKLTYNRLSSFLQESIIISDNLVEKKGDI